MEFEEIITQLFERFSRRVYGSLRRRSRGEYDHHTLEDLTQEVFLKLFRSKKDQILFFWNSPPEVCDSQLAILIYLTARDIHVDHFRATSRRPIEAQPDSTALDSAVANSDPFADTLTAEIRTQLMEAILQLPAKCRKILLLDYDELKDEEMAERLGEPLGTVKSRLHRCRGKLRAAWESRFRELKPTR